MAYSIENYICTTSGITRLELELFSNIATPNLLDYFNLHAVKNNLAKYGLSIAEINDTLFGHIHQCKSCKPLYQDYAYNSLEQLRNKHNNLTLFFPK